MSGIRPRVVAPVPLPDLVAGLVLSGDVDATVDVEGVTLDSRDVAPGWLYAALPGSRAHGADFSAQVAAAGAVAILTDRDGEAAVRATGLPVLVSDRLRADLGVISARVFGDPAGRMTMLGVTGTNGKTTTVALLEAALRAAGTRTGTIGTIGFRLDGQPLPSTRRTVTTPDSPDLQGILAAMADEGARAMALEVSSHAMVLERVAGFRFDVAAFLNLGRDHLDFHPDVEHYFEAKASLFTPEHTRHAVCWVDDPRGAEVARRAAAAGVEVVTVGTSDADHVLADCQPVAPHGGRATLRRATGDVDLVVGLPGVHNLIDAAVALVMLELVGVPTDSALAGLATAQVPGRMQFLDLPGEAPDVVVDFAHTPQAVAATLDALTASHDRIVTVVGSGGDRDAEKRPLMAAAAGERSHVVVITDDNPRSEDPALIRAAMLRGLDGVPGPGGAPEVIEVAGRAAAIETALRLAGPGTVVAVLGKGHEQGQEVAGQILDFDDTVETRRAWDRVREGQR